MLCICAAPRRIRSSVVADRPPARRLCMLSIAALRWMTAIYWPDFLDCYLPLSYLTSSVRGIPSPRAIGFIFSMEKLEGLGYNRMEVAWWLTYSFGQNTSTWQTHRQPRCHCKCRANAVCVAVGRQKSYKTGQSYLLENILRAPLGPPPAMRDLQDHLVTPLPKPSSRDAYNCRIIQFHQSSSITRWNGDCSLWSAIRVLYHCPLAIWIETWPKRVILVMYSGSMRHTKEWKW